jgi:hypothetical protein
MSERNISYQEIPSPPLPKKKREGGESIWAIFLITVGLLLLLNNLGILSWGIWQNLWRFWPVILILSGIELVLGKNWFSKLVVTCLGLLTAALILALSLSPKVPIIDRWLEKHLPAVKEFFQINPGTRPKRIYTSQRKIIIHSDKYWKNSFR